MFLQANKKLLVGTAIVAFMWLVVYYGFAQKKWSDAASAAGEAELARTGWDALYEPRKGMMEKAKAELELDESNRKLKENFTQLKTIEFGNETLLKNYTESAAGSEDHKNYFIKLRKNIMDKAQGIIKVMPPELGFVSRNLDEPVSLNLMRLAMMDRFLTACTEASLNNKSRILKISYGVPLAIELPESAGDDKSGERSSVSYSDDPPRPAKKDALSAAEKSVQPARLIQFPIQITIEAPERVVAQMLFEVQRPTDAIHGYFCLHGMRIVVQNNSVSTGMVEAEFILSALMNDELVGKMAIQWQKKDKEDGRRDSGREGDDGFGGVPDR